MNGSTARELVVALAALDFNERRRQTAAAILATKEYAARVAA